MILLMLTQKSFNLFYITPYFSKIHQEYKIQKSNRFRKSSSWDWQMIHKYSLSFSSCSFHVSGHHVDHHPDSRFCFPPLYFHVFLSNLSLNKILTTTTVPKMLVNIQTWDYSITYTGCLTSTCSVLVLCGLGNCLLAVMAYDSCVAICHQP
jgi:hypothetical protein